MVQNVIFSGVKIAGVTLMALGAMAKYEGLDVKIVPCGKKQNVCEKN
jgi:hypothetical protein